MTACVLCAGIANNALNSRVLHTIFLPSLLNDSFPTAGVVIIDVALGSRVPPVESVADDIVVNIRPVS